MKASLIESPDEHHWVLLEHRITQLTFDAASLRVQSWALDSSVDVRVAAPFTLRQPSGAARVLDPSQTETLAPVLALLRRPLRALTVTVRGELTVEFVDGSAVQVEASGREAAWEVQGGGALEGMSYRAPVGGGVPW